MRVSTLRTYLECHEGIHGAVSRELDFYREKAAAGEEVAGELAKCEERHERGAAKITALNAEIEERMREDKPAEPTYVKLTFYVRRDQVSWLREQHARTGAPVSELIRRALDQVAPAQEQMDWLDAETRRTGQSHEEILREAVELLRLARDEEAREGKTQG